MTALARRGLIGDLSRRLQLASHDELRVIDRILTRLELGRDRYGLLDLATDRRNWRRELGEELLDAVIACTIEAIRAEDEKHADDQRKAAEELAELKRWQHADQRTIVSPASHRIALDDIAEPYEGYDDGEGG